MVCVAIIEDNPVAARLLREYIEISDVHVTAVYGSGEDALNEISTVPLPDVLLVDIGLPGISGIEVTRILKERHPDIEIIIQTVFEDSSIIVEAIRAGASGYILKASSREDIVGAILAVKKGEAFLSGKIARKILREFKHPETDDTDGAASVYELTVREEEILHELIRGSAYKEIAFRLGISIHTVNNHIRKIYEKMRVHSRGEAVARALDSQGRDRNGQSAPPPAS